MKLIRGLLQYTLLLPFPVAILFCLAGSVHLNFLLFENYLCMVLQCRPCFLMSFSETPRDVIVLSLLFSWALKPLALMNSVATWKMSGNVCRLGILPPFQPFPFSFWTAAIGTLSLLLVLWNIESNSGLLSSTWCILTRYWQLGFLMNKSGKWLSNWFATIDRSLNLEGTSSSIDTAVESLSKFANWINSKIERSLWRKLFQLDVLLFSISINVSVALSHDKEQSLLHGIYTVVWVLTEKFFVNAICLIQRRKELSNSLLVTLACKQTNDFIASNIFSRFAFNDLTNSLLPIDASVFHDINTFICSAILSSTDFTSNNVLAKFELRCNK